MNDNEWDEGCCEECGCANGLHNEDGCQCEDNDGHPETLAILGFDEEFCSCSRKVIRDE